MSETSSVSKKPYRFEIDVVLATADPDAATRLWCSVNDLLESIPDVFPQGGYFGPMPKEEIIPDSPLARALNGS